MNSPKLTLIIFLLQGFFLLAGCNENEHKVEKVEIINVNTLNFGVGTEIILNKDGYFKLDSNTVLPDCDSTLIMECQFVRELIESRSTIKLKSEWEDGNESPSDGIWLNYSNDTTKGFFAINTTEGHIGIYGSSNESIKNGIRVFESLFVKAFKGKEKRKEWYIPKMIIEHRE